MNKEIEIKLAALEQNRAKEASKRLDIINNLSKGQWLEKIELVKADAKSRWNYVVDCSNLLRR